MIDARRSLAGTDLSYYSLEAVREAGLGEVGRLPMTVKVLLEMLLREAGRERVSESSLRALAGWPDFRADDAQLPYTPARVLLQDFTGVPAVVDLAAMRSAMRRAGQDASRIDPQVQVDLVIDHSVQVD